MRRIHIDGKQIAMTVALIVIVSSLRASIPHAAYGGMRENAQSRHLTASNAIAQEAFTYDLMDRLSSAATVVSNATFATTYARDLGGLVTNLVYAPGKTLTCAYDPDGRPASVSDWLGHTWAFSYDGAGKPTGGTAPSGILSTNTYDDAGCLASWSVGTLAGRTITRDAAGLKTRDDISAGPLPAPHNVRYADNTFDAADRLISATIRYGSHTNAAIAETYLYDGNGALTNLVSGSNAVFSAAYDPLGRLDSLQGGAGVPPAAFGYDALGNRIVSTDRLLIPDHLSEGAGQFSADPSWENVPRMLMDVSTVASVMTAGLSALPTARVPIK